MKRMKPPLHILTQHKRFPRLWRGHPNPAFGGTSQTPIPLAAHCRQGMTKNKIERQAVPFFKNVGVISWKLS